MNSNYNDDYKNKYLKYKKKYLDLQKESTNLQLIGGANCPNIGFIQHFNECWHDSYSTIFLFSDNVADHIQRIFDSNGSYKFNLEDCIQYALTNMPKTLIPFNIEEENMEVFLKYAREYIKNLYIRYSNEKLHPHSYKRMPRNASQQVIDAILNTAPTKSVGRPRRNSINQSLSCTEELYNFTNINLISKMEWSEQIHLGDSLHYLSISNLVNFFLLNYYPEALKIEKQPTNYLNFNTLNLLELMVLKDPRLILERITYIISHLEIILGLFKKNLCGILVALLPKEGYIRFLQTGIFNYPGGHAVSFFTCNNEDKFYDNMGIDSTYDIDPKTLPEPDTYPDKLQTLKI